MLVRPISLRAFDQADLMVDADLVEDRDLEDLIARFLSNPHVVYLHAHYAKRGCYAAPGSSGPELSTLRLIPL